MDKQSADTFAGPLNEGVISIRNTCTSLLEAQVDPIIGQCLNYEKIREHIEQAEQYLKKSETMTKEKLVHLDKQMERLIRDQRNAELQIKENQKAKDKLNIKKNSAEESLRFSKAALEQAGKIVALTKAVMKTQTGRRKTNKRVAIAGAAVMAIPILGWIPGPIMMSVGVCKTRKASKALRKAEDELETHESKVNENNRNVSDYQSRISTVQNEIRVTEMLLNNTQKKIEEVKQHLEITAGNQEKVRKAVNLLSVLSGRVSVLEIQTQHSILWNPVVQAMKDVIKAVGNVAENQLFSEGASGIINMLRGDAVGLQALCNSPSNPEHDSFY